MERFNGRGVRDAVHAFRTEVALESFDHALGAGAIVAGDRDVIAIERQHRLQRLDRRTAVALLEKAAAETRQAVRPGPPPASIPSVTMPKTYNERANLFQRDMMGYRAVQRASGL